MVVNKIIASITKGFRTYVQQGLFNCDFIGPESEYYSGGRCHSRVLGLLTQCLQQLDYHVDIERSVYFHTPKIKGKRRMNKFRPDITVVDGKDRIVGIVEYETIDATKEHLFEKVDYFKRALPENPDLKFIVFMPTLTTLVKRPSAWIEKNRSIYVEPLTKAISQLSSVFPSVEFCLAYLNEDGIFSKLIVNGSVKAKLNNNIFK